MKTLTKQTSHYLVLTGIVAFAFWGIVKFSYDPVFQTATVLALAVSYVTWGMVHHWLHQNLNLKITSEYIFLALLATVILLSIIWL